MNWSLLCSIVPMCLLLTGCGEKVQPLKGQDFSSGDWLLVDTYSDRTIQLIDDEQVLIDNADALSIRWHEGHGYTTCDGLLRLFKDGELVLQQSYLDYSYLTLPSDLLEAFITGRQEIIDPGSSGAFNRAWDSLAAFPHNHPTKYLSLPEEKQLIWLYVGQAPQ